MLNKYLVHSFISPGFHRHFRQSSMQSVSYASWATILYFGKPFVVEKVVMHTEGQVGKGDITTVINWVPSERYGQNLLGQPKNFSLNVTQLVVVQAADTLESCQFSRRSFRTNNEEQFHWEWNASGRTFEPTTNSSTEDLPGIVLPK